MPSTAMYDVLLQSAKEAGFDSIVEAIRYAGKAKNDSTVNSEAINEGLPNDIVVFLNYLVSLQLQKGDISPCAEELLGRYRVEAKNVSNGLETPGNGISSSVSASVCCWCKEREARIGELSCGQC